MLHQRVPHKAPTNYIESQTPCGCFWRPGCFCTVQGLGIPVPTPFLFGIFPTHPDFSHSPSYINQHRRTESSCLQTQGIQAHMCGGVHVHVGVCVQARGDLRCCSSFETGPLPGLGLSSPACEASWPASPTKPPVSASQHWDYRCVPRYHAFLRIKVRSLYGIANAFPSDLSPQPTHAKL